MATMTSWTIKAVSSIIPSIREILKQFHHANKNFYEKKETQKSARKSMK